MQPLVTEEPHLSILCKGHDLPPRSLRAVIEGRPVRGSDLGVNIITIIGITAIQLVVIIIFIVILLVRVVIVIAHGAEAISRGVAADLAQDVGGDVELFDNVLSAGLAERGEAVCEASKGDVAGDRGG